MDKLPITRGGNEWITPNDMEHDFALEMNRLFDLSRNSTNEEIKTHAKILFDYFNTPHEKRTKELEKISEQAQEKLNELLPQQE